MRKLTIGMATHDDYDGVYFTIQSIRMFHPEILHELEFVIIDNNPSSSHGKSIRSFIDWIDEPVQYLPFTNYQSSTIKNKVFELSDTPYVMCVDCHVLLFPNSIKKLIDFYDEGKDDGNLLQGPLIYDDMKNISTHFDWTWSDYMWGTWKTDDRGLDINGDPFEIDNQGMGLFSCRKDSWLGFSKDFRGFGGEEGYIHKKYKKAGKKIICLPFLRWLHRFERPNGINYRNVISDRFHNYYLGMKELDLNPEEMITHFEKIIPKIEIDKIKSKIDFPKESNN